MKTLIKNILSLVTFAVLLTVSFAQAQEISIVDMSEPPFWMSSYDEFNDLQTEQKDFYLEQLKKELIKFPKTAGVSSQTWEDAGDWYRSWGSIRVKVYQSCLNPEFRAQCDKLADLRVETLDFFANQKLENRAAKKALAAGEK